MRNSCHTKQPRGGASGPPATSDGTNVGLPPLVGAVALVAALVVAGFAAAAVAGFAGCVGFAGFAGFDGGRCCGGRDGVPPRVYPGPANAHECVAATGCASAVATSPPRLLLLLLPLVLSSAAGLVKSHSCTMPVRRARLVGRADVVLVCSPPPRLAARTLP